ncbi:MAG: hypothetical protein RI575_14360 [Balneolaceae bacterium]|nr:hypothetical protein [Balneolaceae bacterium]MDR9409564.1 hypothetical protein [Balneolaceae bacterium]
MQALFIQGPEKTATSTTTGILNCHPEIFILFETYLGQPKITKYGNQLLEKYPDARHFFRMEVDYGKPVLDFFQYLKDRESEYSYKYVGTKLNCLNPDITQKVHNHKIIFTKRDVRSWLVKQSIIERYRTDLDVVIPTVEYLNYIIKSTLYQHAYHLWMEDLIKENSKIIDELSDYLDLKLKPHTDDWWDKFGNMPNTNPKSVFKLSHVHHSSKKEPETLDTKYEIKDIPFWDDTNQIFEKYFRNSDFTNISESEISNDLKTINKLKRYAPIPVKEAYSYVKSIRFGFAKPRETYYYSKTGKKGNKRSIFSRIKERVRRIINVGLNNYHVGKGIAYGTLFLDEIQITADLLFIE